MELPSIPSISNWPQPSVECDMTFFLKPKFLEYFRANHRNIIFVLFKSFYHDAGWQSGSSFGCRLSGLIGISEQAEAQNHYR